MIRKYIGGGLVVLGLLFSVGSIAAPAQAASLTSAQVQAIIGLLQSFGADQSVINNVSATLNGQATAGTNASCLTLSYNLYAGLTDSSTNGQVSQLQQFLSVSSITGYFGPMTQQAVQNWQSAHGIVSSGSPDTTGYGFVGPATRAAMACSGSTSANTSTTNTQTTPSSNQTTNQSNSATQPQTNPVVINSFTVSPSTVSSGQSVTFSWNSNLIQNDIQQYGGGCQLNKGTPAVGTDIDYGGASGSFTYTPSSSATYTLQCYSGGKDGSPIAQRSVSVTVNAPQTTPATTINVTYPQSGNVLANSTGKTNNQIATIQWSEQNGNYPVNIWVLNQSGQIIKSIATNAPNTGSYVWAYDPSLQSGTYEIEIDVAYTAGSAGGQDRAYSGFFTLQTSVPNITVTYPNGGEQISYNTGKDVDFNATWTATNYSNTVYIFLSSTSGSLCLLGSAPSSQGTFPVTIGTNFTCQNGQPTPVSGGQYKIYVAGDDGLGDGKETGDFSDGYFTLTAANPTSIPVPVINSFTASSNSVASGQPVTFSWNVANWNSSSVSSLLQQTGGGCWLENSLNPYGGQSVPPVGSYTLSPTASATYTLECDSTGKGDGSPKATQQVAVSVH